MTTELDNTKKRPAFVAFAVPDKKSNHERAFWHEVGAAWPHADGEGFDIILAAIPINGRIVLRASKPTGGDQ